VPFRAAKPFATTVSFRPLLGVRNRRHIAVARLVAPRRIPAMVVVITLAMATLAGCSGGGASDASADDLDPDEQFDELAYTLSTIARQAEVETTIEADPEPPEEEQGPVFPLSGAELTDSEMGTAPALMVKIDNHPKARPPVGIDQADIVFDYRAEGITRLAAVFHSQRPEAVGPVRSSRTADFNLLRGLGNPLFAASGGNDNVMAGLASVEAQVHTAISNRAYYRDGSRPRPHNMFIAPADMYALAAGSSTPPPQWFQYRRASEELPSTATPANGVVAVNFTEGPRVTFEWDPDAGWRRFQDGAPHQVADGTQLAPENVAILVSTYEPSPADSRSPELQSTGAGELVVLTDGHVITGRWERPNAFDVPLLLDGEGNMIHLTPGQTFVLWPEAGQIDLGG